MKTGIPSMIGIAMLCAATTSMAHPGHENDDSLQEIALRNQIATTIATNKVSITVEGQYRVVRANGVPDHKPGQFPNRGNPNRISAQNYTFLMPLKPKIAEQKTKLGMYPFGVAVNGVVFDPGAAEWWDNDPRSGWQYEPMSGSVNLGVDQNNAHVQPTGAYHYHAIPVGLVNKLSDGKKKMVLVGWAADGFPIYGPTCYSDAKDAKSGLKDMKSSYRVKKGARTDGPGGDYDGSFVEDYEFVSGAGDLDDCNGRFGVTAEFPEGTYYYVLTADFPFIPRYFKGTPDSTFFRQGPPGGRGPRGMPPGGGGPGGERRPPGPQVSVRGELDELSVRQP